MVCDLTSLKASIANFVSSCANKLRGQHSVAGSVTVFITSNYFREDLEQYSNGATFNFATPTSDTLEITNAAMMLLESMYRSDILNSSCKCDTWLRI